MRSSQRGAEAVEREEVLLRLTQFVTGVRCVDIAFNNAGIEHGGPVTEITEEDYQKVFDINVLGVFLSQKYEIPAMLKSGGGVIINTSSILGQIAMPGAAVYNASKHAVEGITKTTALELAEQGIRVNSVAPGAIATHMIDRFAGEEGTEGRQHLASLHPRHRTCSSLPNLAAAGTQRDRTELRAKAV